MFLTLLVLTGCFRNKPQATQVDEVLQEEDFARPSEQAASGSNPEAIAPPSPSFSDGDYYLEALTKKDPGACDKISESKLKERCRGELAQ